MASTRPRFGLSTPTSSSPFTAVTGRCRGSSRFTPRATAALEYEMDIAPVQDWLGFPVHQRDVHRLGARGRLWFSVGSRGRIRGNIGIERLWRSLKYEVVYLHELRYGLEVKCPTIGGTSSAP